MKLRLYKSLLFASSGNCNYGLNLFKWFSLICPTDLNGRWVFELDLCNAINKIDILQFKIDKEFIWSASWIRAIKQNWYFSFVFSKKAQIFVSNLNLQPNAYFYVAAEDDYECLSEPEVWMISSRKSKVKVLMVFKLPPLLHSIEYGHEKTAAATTTSTTATSTKTTTENTIKYCIFCPSGFQFIYWVFFYPLSKNTTFLYFWLKALDL